MAILLVVCCFLAYYFLVVLGIATVFTHFFYVPIILASLWWKRKGLAVALFLALLLICSHHFLRDDVVTANDYFRALMFVVIGFVVALLSERIAKKDEALRESESEKKAVLDGITTNIRFVDENLEILWVNNADIVSVNKSLEEMIGHKCYEFWGDQEQICANCPAIKTVREKKTNQIIRHSPDGTVWDLKTEPVFGDSGNLVGVVEIAHDITDKSQLEAQLQQAQKMEAIGRLAGGVAHDFNNLLTTIIGYADLMLMGLAEDDPFRENLEQIKGGGKRSASLTRQLLAFSRKQILQPVVLDLNELIKGFVKMLERLIGEDVELETALVSGLRRVEADPGQMEQVIMNLVINARDAMPGGGKVIIETANADLDEDYAKAHDVSLQPGPYVMLAVSDTGTGMDEETRSLIFEPFFTTKEVGKGTGLGLSTVYGIVKQSGGYIWVYSKPGQGTTFKIYLPEVEGETVQRKKEQTSTDDLTGSETILIVEDNDMLRNLAREILQLQGYRILEAENGIEALRIGEEHGGKIHLMITDVVMPKMGGKEVADRLQPLHPQMKVIYMSGYTDNSIAHHGILAPELNFLEKPFSPEILARKVREVLDKKQD